MLNLVCNERHTVLVVCVYEVEGVMSFVWCHFLSLKRECLGVCFGEPLLRRCGFWLGYFVS